MNKHNSTQTPLNPRFPTFHRMGRRLFSPRGLRAFGVLAFGLVTLVALFYAVENWRGAREWKRVRAELVAQGEPLSFAELVPPMPPAGENFAMSPIFEGAFDTSIDPETGESGWFAWHKLRTAQHPSSLEGLGLDTDGTWQLGERARVTWRNQGIKLSEDQLAVLNSTNGPFGIMREFLADKAPDMLEVEAALRRPLSQFPVHYEDNASAVLPHLGELKRLARLFSFRALARLDEGAPEQALEDVTTALRLADSLKNEPLLISQLVRLSILSQVLQPVWEGLAEGVWTASQLGQLQARLGSVDLLGACQFAMRGERIMGTDLADIVERKRDFASIGSPTDYSASEQVRDRLINHAPKGWYLHNKAFIGRLHNDFSVPAVDPAERRVHLDRARDYWTNYDAAISDDSTLFIAKLVMPQAEKAVVRFANGQTGLDQAVVACALERYKMANGDYPAALDALVPEFMNAVPHDLIDGEPLRYRREGDGFELYSIGSNEIDDGGVAAFKETHGGRDWRRDEGDWVWKYPAGVDR